MVCVWYASRAEGWIEQPGTGSYIFIVFTSRAVYGCTSVINGTFPRHCRAEHVWTYPSTYGPVDPAKSQKKGTEAERNITRDKKAVTLLLSRYHAVVS